MNLCLSEADVNRIKIYNEESFICACILILGRELLLGNCIIGFKC